MSCKCEQVLERVERALRRVYEDVREAYMLSGVGSAENEVYEVLVYALHAAIAELKRELDTVEVD